MFTFVKKLLGFASIYVFCQLLLMLIVWLLFKINLFETSKSIVAMEDLTVVQLKTMVSLNQTIGLFLPAWIFLLLFYGKRTGAVLDFKISKRIEIPLLSLTMLMFTLPVIQWLSEVNSLIPMTDWMQSTSGEINQYLTRIIEMDAFSDLLINVFIIAIIPAVSEELLFRGLIQKELILFFKEHHSAIWITAVIFSAFHFQFEGFLPRLFLGALLGYGYYYSRSFFIPILLHFTYNAIMVVGLYLRPDAIDSQKIDNASSNALVVILSFVIVVYLMWQIKKRSKNE